MKIFLKALLITFLLIGSLPAPTYGQGGDEPVIPPELPLEDLRFQHLTTEDGLSEGRVWGITQDRRGFMWFATLQGLNRYDGYEFKVYKEQGNNPNSPGGKLFWTVYEDQQGMIWVSSPGGSGLSRFDPFTEQWTRFQHDQSDPHSLSSNNVYNIIEDRSGVLWIGTDGGGLNRFDDEDEDGRGRFTRFQHDPDDLNSLGSDSIVSLYEDHFGAIWIGGFSGGLTRFDPQKETFTRYQHDPQDLDSLSHDVVFAVYEDQSGVLWVGTYGGGLNRFDRETETFTRYQTDPEDPSSLSNNVIVDILEDPSGTLWIATFGGGLNRYHPESDNFTSYQHDRFDPNSLGSNTLASLYVDNFGALWIGTIGNGISKLDYGQQGFKVIRHDPVDTNSLNYNDVRTVFEDRSGDLWVGTFGGLNRFDPETGRYTHYLHDPADPTSLSDDHVWAITEDSTGALWVGVDPGGLNRFDRDTETFTHYRSDPADPCSLSDDIIITLYADRTGILWIGTYNGGLDAFDPQLQGELACFTHYRHDPEDPNSVGGGTVWSIIEDSAGVLWVGTASGGLCHLNRETDNFKCYTHDPEDENSLSNNTVIAIHEDREGVLWIGTGDGLDRFDPQTGNFTRYTTADGLVNASIYGILEDGDGHLWISTAHGMSHFDPAARIFRNYTASDGLQGDVFGMSSYYKSSKGEMFFGGPNGLTAFYPENVRENPNIPPVKITGLALSNEPVSIGADSPLQQSILDTEGLELTHDERVISFEFAALNYTSPEKNRYRYKLENFDEAWIEVGSERRFATYTNLDPGEYIFKVLGSNNDGLWNEEGASIHLTITPPWWGTWWFQGGLLLLLMGLVAGGFTWQRGSARKRERQLKIQVTERTHELNERVKELNCLYGISRLAGMRGSSLEQILSGAVDLLPPAMHYPEIACARILLDGQEFKTNDFQETPWQLSSALVVRGEQAGQVEVSYLEEGPETDEGLFLEEEQLLLDAVAERLGRITERKQAEVALQASEEKYRDLVEKVSDVIYRVNLQGEIIYVNPAAEALIGLPPEEIAGQPFAQFIHPDDLDQLQNNLQALSSGAAPGPSEYRLLTASGETRWIRVTSQPIREGGREVTGLQGVLTDFTERKEMEGQLEEIATVAERDRLTRRLHDAVTQTLFSASVIAESTPRFMDNKPDLAKRNLNQLSIMLRGAMAEMRSMLIELRPAALVGKSLDELIDTLVEASQIRLNCPIDLVIDGQGTLPEDVTIIFYRIAQEAITNIIKYAEADEVSINITSNEDSVIMVVKDNGIGFEQSEIPIGHFGLHIMDERIDQIGGDLSIDSKPGHGTQIRASWSAGGKGVNHE